MKTARKNEVIEWNNKKYKMPFDITYELDNDNKMKIEVIENRFSGDSCSLPSFAVSIYDTIIGSELVNEHQIMQKGIDWFSRNFTSQYYVLLD